jgi:hypothetical protein
VAIRLRIELLDVTCRDTDDLFVSDTFYMTAVLAVSDTTRSAVITDPIKMKAGQTHAFSAPDAIVFDGPVEDREAVIGGVKAYEEDFAKDWTHKTRWAKEILRGLPPFSALPESLSAAATVILTAAGTVLDLQAHSDRDDLLGCLPLVIPMAGPLSEEERWVLKEEGLGLSTWDYTVRCLITRTQIV